MNSQKTVFILSDNHDFIEVLSSFVTQELGVIYQVIASNSEIMAKNMAVLVTNKPTPEEYNLPIITVNLPVRLQGLLADIQTVFANMAGVDLLDIDGGFQLSLKHKILTQKSSEISVDLTDKESQLLQIIVESGENGVLREVLLKEIWKIDSALDTHTLETHIYRLRKKIKDTFGSEMIKASEGGYRL